MIEKKEILKIFFAQHPYWRSYGKRKLFHLKKKEEKITKRLNKMKKIAELRYKNLMTLKEIAEIMGLPASTTQEIIGKFNWKRPIKIKDLLLESKQKYESRTT